MNKGRKGRRLLNIAGEIRAKEIGNGVCELVKEPDVLCVMPEKKENRTHHMLFGSVALFIGMIAAMIYLAPALGTLVFGIVAWCCFAAFATGE